MPSALRAARGGSGPLVPSRRTLLEIVATGALATVFPALAGDAFARKRKKRRKRRKMKPAAPSPAVQVAAACTGASKFSAGIEPPQRFAQTFTPKVSGNLIRAEVAIDKEAGSVGDYFLHLGRVDNFGVPTNEVQAVASLANPDVPVGRSTVTFTFPNPGALTAGTRFALTLNRSGTGLLTWDLIVGDQCGGEAFRSTGQTAPFTPFGAGSDFVYTVLVQ